MGLPQLIFNNKCHFEDITSKEYSYKYEERVSLEGHSFKHIAYGIYAADPIFTMDHNEAERILASYRNISLAVINSPEETSDDTIHRVYFAYEYAGQYNNFISNVIKGQLRDDVRFTSLCPDIAELDSIDYGFYHISQKLRDNLPEIKHCFMPIYKREVLEDGSRPWIQLDNNIGIKVEDGIYYFPRSGDSIGHGLVSLPIIDLNTRFNVPVAAICHSTDFHLSFDTAVEYMAIGNEHFPRLRKLCDLLSPSEHYYHEFNVGTENMNESDTFKPMSTEEIIDAINKAKSERNTDFIPEKGAEELVEGKGFTDMSVAYNRPFFGYSGFRHYDMAYRLGEDLVLATKAEGEIEFEIHKLRFLSGLYVKIEEKLTCGIDYPVIYPVIDCTEERIKEILSPEIYELYEYEKHFVIKNG